MKTIYIPLYNAAGRRIRLWHGDTTPPTAQRRKGDIWVNTAAGELIVLGQIFASATIDFPSISAGATSERTVSVPGAVVGDYVIATPAPGIEAGLVWSAYVSAADTVTIRLANVTAAAIDPASRTWRVQVLKGV